MSKPNNHNDDTSLYTEREQLLQKIVDLALFKGADRQVAVLADPAKKKADFTWPPFPATVKVIQSAGCSAFLEEMTGVLTEEEPDCLFLAPPLGTAEKLPAKLRRAYPGLGLHEIALHIAVENAPLGCRMGVWLPRGFFVNLASQRLRSRLVEEATPRLLVEFADSMPDMPSMRLFILQKDAGSDKLVRFFRVPGSPVDAFSNERQDALLADLRRLLKKGGGSTEFGFVLREGLSADTPWLYHRHHPSYQQRIEDLQHYGDVRPLGELVDIWLGFQNAPVVNELVPGHERERGIAVLEGREIGKDGTLSGSEPRYRLLGKSAEAYLLQTGDICLRGDLGDDRHLSAVLIREEMLPLVANNSVMVLRPKPEVNLDPEFLTAYLQSDHVVGSLRAQGIAQRLFERSLADVQVPLQDEELAAVMHDLRQAAQTLGAWQEEAQAAIRSLFVFESAKDARAHLLASGRRVRQRERAAMQIDDLSYRLRSGLPHPLAYRWRAAETAPITLDGYVDVLDCAEVAACYLASMALVLMRSIAEPVPYLTTLVPRLSDPDRASGTNFGDWVAIIRDLNQSRALKRRGNVPFYQITRFLDDEQVNEALSLLKEHRDDYAHGRRPRGTELVAAMDQCREALAHFFEGIEFLSEYSLRYIEETNRDSLSGITHYSYRDMAGDHPLVSMIEAETSTAELEAHSLYLTDRTGEMYLMRPYLVRRQCAQCDGWETFVLDQFDARSDCCTLKSLEKGHTIEDDQIAAVFKHVSLLE